MENEVQRFRGLEVERFRGSEVERFRGLEVQRERSCEGANLPGRGWLSGQETCQVEGLRKYFMYPVVVVPRLGVGGRLSFETEDD